MESSEEEIKLIHKEVLYPVVRIRTEKAGGSGLIVYSRPTPENPEVFETFIITCHHVIEDAIKFIQRWSSIASRNVMIEDRQTVSVEVFKYEKLSRCVGSTTLNADIIAWDKILDIAVLKIKCEDEFKHVAKLYPKGKEEDVKLGRSLVTCGCSLGHEPIFTFGSLVAKHDIIENKEYWMSTANSIFGNSGGAVFLKGTHEYVGITARITTLQLGFGVDVITWMGFFVPISSIYGFFDDNFLMFIYNKGFTSKQCAELKKNKMDEEEKKLVIPDSALPPPSKRDEDDR